MNQDKLLKAGAIIYTRDMPHTPTTGQIEVKSVEHGLMHAVYSRTELPGHLKEIHIPRADAEYMIVHGFWIDPDQVREKPLATESQLDGLWDEIMFDLRAAITRGTYWIERHDLDQIRQSMHKALDFAFDERLKEMKGC